MYQAFLIKYGEIGIKGKNRYLFEDALMRQIRIALRPVEGEFNVTKEQGRVYVEAVGEYDYDATVEALKNIFGIVEFCPVLIEEDSDFEKICKSAVDFWGKVYGDTNASFKVRTRRGDKHYPMTSMEISAGVGEALLDEYPGLKVDVHEPELMLEIEVRERVFIYSQRIQGLKGMPVGTAGKAMLLLSGGIDSPVAGYMVAKRGVKIEATYFHAPPYTSERAKQKVVDLARIVAKYAGPIQLNIVNFTDIQMYIYKQCKHEELTIIMRRYMMRIAEHFAKESGCLGLITGESIGQVASQTMHSLYCTNAVCDLPVFRPLIAFDKQDIVDLSEKIGTYETSILPYEDCCTIFVAKHPVTKPNKNVIERSETHLAEQIDEMLKTAIETTEKIMVEA